VNVLGVVAMTQRFVPLLRAHQGRVVNMGSIAGVMAPAFYSAYRCAHSSMF
jgi:NAD(P)-dependent dehydrogenase (short-subunit alcohol dehydrogenase family)